MSDNTVTIASNSTYHGAQRIDERVEHRGEVELYIDRVLRNGKTINHFSGKKLKYLQGVLTKSKRGNSIRVFGGQIYIFSPDMCCVTVINFPAYLK